MTGHAEQPSRERLLALVTDIFGGMLGLNAFAERLDFKPGPVGTLRESPFFAGLRVTFIYALLFCAPLFLFDDRSCELIGLQVYGALWAGWVTVTARIASSPILKTIEEDILPELSETAAEKICTDLERRYSRKRVLASAWILDAAGAIAAGYLIDHDLAAAFLQPSIWQILI